MKILKEMTAFQSSNNFAFDNDEKMDFTEQTIKRGEWKFNN